jgi:hypothetical protein
MSKKERGILIDTTLFAKNLHTVVEVFGGHFRIRLGRTGAFHDMLFLHSYEEFKELLDMLHDVDDQIPKEYTDVVHDA